MKKIAQKSSSRRAGTKRGQNSGVRVRDNSDASSSARFSDYELKYKEAEFTMADIDDWHPPVGVRPNKKFS